MLNARVSRFALWNSPVLENLDLVADWRDLAVLEIGCGSGLLSAHIAALGARAYSIDIIKPKSCATSQFAVGDIEAMPFAAETFDVILSCSSLQYVQHARAIGEINRVLKKGGWLLLHENGRNNPIIVLGRLWRRLRARHNAQIGRYVDSIYGYINVNTLVHNGDFTLVKFKPHYLLGPIHQIATGWQSDFGRFISRQLMRFDSGLLRSLGFLRSLGWFNCYALQKNSEDAPNVRELSVGENIAHFRQGRGFHYLWRAIREVRRRRRLLEMGYGLYCFMSRRPSETNRAPSSVVEEVLRNTLHRLNRVSFDLRDHVFSHTNIRNAKVPPSFPVRRASCVDMCDRIVAGEYAEESGARILSVTNNAVFVSRHYEREAGIKHIHLVHPLSDKMFFVATGDTRKALDLWEVAGDSVFFRRRLMSHFAGFTAACTVRERTYFGTDFAQRPNYIFCLDSKRTYFLPRPLFTMWVSDMMAYKDRYIVGICCTLHSYGGSGVFIFDARDEKFVLAEYLRPRNNPEPLPAQSSPLNRDYEAFCRRPKLGAAILLAWLMGAFQEIPLPMLPLG